MTTKLNTITATIMKTTPGLLCALLLTSGIARGQQKSMRFKGPLTGAWQVTKVQTTGPNARTVTNPQPGLYLFTGKYFSIMMVMGDHPRPIHPTLPEVPKATPQEILAVYGPYVANTGTYEVSGDTLIMHPMVSKNPELMGGSVTYTFTIGGNTLIMKMVKMRMGANVPPPSSASGDLDTYTGGIKTIGGLVSCPNDFDTSKTSVEMSLDAARFA